MCSEILIGSGLVRYILCLGACKHGQQKHLCRFLLSRVIWMSQCRGDVISRGTRIYCWALVSSQVRVRAVRTTLCGVGTSVLSLNACRLVALFWFWDNSNTIIILIERLGLMSLVWAQLNRSCRRLCNSYSCSSEPCAFPSCLSLQA